MPFPVDIKYVKEAELKLMRKLPLGYVARMCKCNGGTVSTGIDHWFIHPIFDDSDKKRLKRSCNDIIRETALVHDRHGFPANALAIADNGGRDKLILLPEIDSNRYGEGVFWWDHDTGNVEKVADSFEEL